MMFIWLLKMVVNGSIKFGLVLIGNGKFLEKW
jgi:hypothetical protein